MTRPVRWLLRIAIALFLLVVIAVVAGIMLLDTFVRSVMIKGLHNSTGMDVKIASVHIGLRQPVIAIEDILKLYNTPEFGGKLCLDMPELHMEYDPVALRAGKYHFPLVRLNLAEIDVVTDKQGRSNFDSIAKQSKAKSGTNTISGIKFEGIDNLDLTLGKLHVSNFKSGQDDEVSFGIKNEMFHNVKSEADITGVALLMAMRGSSSGGHSNVDLDQLLKNLTAH